MKRGSYKIDIYEQVKTMLRLYHQLDKSKRILSNIAFLLDLACECSWGKPKWFSVTNCTIESANNFIKWCEDEDA
jgi:hypothetical protein